MNEVTLHKMKITRDTQLGYAIGKYQVLPNLYFLKGDNDIQINGTKFIVSPKESELHNMELFERDWLMYKRNGNEEMGSAIFKDWRLFVNRLILQYLPHTLSFNIDSLFTIKNEKSFLQGVEYALWDSDVSNYTVLEDSLVKYNSGGYKLTVYLVEYVRQQLNKTENE